MLRQKITTNQMFIDRIEDQLKLAISRLESDEIQFMRVNDGFQPNIELILADFAEKIIELFNHCFETLPEPRNIEPSLVKPQEKPKYDNSHDSIF